MCFHMEQVSSYLISKNVYEVYSPLLFLGRPVQIFARRLFQDSRDSFFMKLLQKTQHLKVCWVIVKIKKDTDSLPYSH
jgi:cytochrome c oxidase assembly factor CtaG